MTYPLAIDAGTANTAAAIWRSTGPVALALRDRPGSADPGPSSRGPDSPGPDSSAPGPRGAQTVPTVPGPPERTIDLVVAAATRQLGGPPGRLLLTVPTWWPQGRRDLLRRSGSIAGFADVQVIPATVAAATYHAAGRPLDPGAAVAVYDLGAGGFDAAVLVRTSQGFELCAEPVGDDRLGGHAFDRALADVIARDLPGIDPAKALAVAPAVKTALSGRDVVDLSLWIPGAAPTWLTRDRFEDAIRDDVTATVDRLRQAMRDAEIDPRMLAAVLLAGGSSRLPLVTELVHAGVGAPPLLLDRPKLGICLGAAILHARATTGAAPAAPGRADPGDPKRPDPLPALALLPAGTHWARQPRPAAPDPTVIVRLDEGRPARRGRLLVRLLLLTLAAAALVAAAIILAALR